MKCYDWLVLIINHKKVLRVWVDTCKLFYRIFIYKNTTGGESVHLSSSHQVGKLLFSMYCYNFKQLNALNLK